jgi:hypothetical protein
MADYTPRFSEARFGDAITAVRRFIYEGVKVELPYGWKWWEGQACGYYYSIGLELTPTRESYQFSVRRDSYKMTEKHRQVVMAVCGSSAFVTSDYQMIHNNPKPITPVYALAVTEHRALRRRCVQLAVGNPAVAAAFQQRLQAEAVGAEERAAAAAVAEAAALAQRAEAIARDENDARRRAIEDTDRWAQRAANYRAEEAAAELAVEAPQELVLEECVADCDDPQPCEPESIPA